jgi:hypothetical protein
MRIPFIVASIDVSWPPISSRADRRLAARLRSSSVVAAALNSSIRTLASCACPIAVGALPPLRPAGLALLQLLYPDAR